MDIQHKNIGLKRDGNGQLQPTVSSLNSGLTLRKASD